MLYNHIKTASLTLRGANQIRTGVNGFADRYLTTRTWHHEAVKLCERKINKNFQLCKNTDIYLDSYSGLIQV